MKLSVTFDPELVLNDDAVGRSLATSGFIVFTVIM